MSENEAFSTALIEAVKYLTPLVVGWLAKVRKDMNALFPKLRALEMRVAALEGAIKNDEEAAHGG